MEIPNPLNLIRFIPAKEELYLIDVAVCRPSMPRMAWRLVHTPDVAG